jgi:hypothetical protein
LEQSPLMNGIYRAALLEAPEVHQAAGVIMAQLGVSSVEAIALLGAHAANTSWPLVDVAGDVLAGRLRLSSPGGGVAPNRTQRLCPSAGAQNSDTHGSSVGVGAGSGEVGNVSGSPSGRLAPGSTTARTKTPTQAGSPGPGLVLAAVGRVKIPGLLPQRRGATSSRPGDNVPRGRPGGGHTPALSNPHRAGLLSRSRNDHQVGSFRTNPDTAAGALVMRAR